MDTKLWHIALFVAILLAVAAVMHPTNFRTAWMYLNSGRLHEAISKLSTITQKHPQDYRSLKMLALALEETGDVEDADRVYEKLIETKPRDDNFKELVRFYTWTNRPEKAKEAYEKWYEFRRQNKMPFDDDDGKQMLDDLYAYELLYKDFARAIEIADLRKGIEPKEAGAIDDDLIALYEAAGNISAAAEHLEKLLQTNDRNTYALESLMQIAASSGKTDVVKKYLVKNLDESPNDGGAWKRMILFETRSGDLDSANEWYRKWIASQPGNSQLKKDYVEWMLGTEQQKTAISYLERLAAAKPSDPYFTDTLTKLYEWNGVKDKLVPIYLSRFEKNPRDRENAKNLIWMLNDMKRYGESEKVLKKLLEIYPNDREYARMLIDLYDSQNKENESVAILEKIARSSDDPKLLKRLGEHYMWSSGKSPTK